MVQSYSADVKFHFNYNLFKWHWKYFCFSAYRKIMSLKQEKENDTVNPIDYQSEVVEALLYNYLMLEL